eukprot:scaffold212_cov108-Skeletonema_dohrnii-CCMP3373.AAC.6
MEVSSHFQVFGRKPEAAPGGLRPDSGILPARMGVHIMCIDFKLRWKWHFIPSYGHCVDDQRIA